MFTLGVMNFDIIGFLMKYWWIWLPPLLIVLIIFFLIMFMITKILSKIIKYLINKIKK